MLMSVLRDATTDAAVIDGLSLRVQARASAGVYGADRRGTLRERRTRRKIDRAFADCLEWYRGGGGAMYENGLAWSQIEDDTPHSWVAAIMRTRNDIRSDVRSALAGGILGWLAWLGFQWLLEIIVREFVEWLLSSESQAWREAA